MSFEELRRINKNKIEKIKKDIIENPNDNKLKMQLQISQEIDGLFMQDEAIFFKLQTEDAIKILEQILEPETINNAYLELISPSNYSELLNNFKI